MMKLIDLLTLAGVDSSNFKIHCARGTHPTPLEAFFDGKFKQWQEFQSKKNFQRKHILSLIHLGGKRWLFAGFYEVLDVKKGKWRKHDCYIYSTKEINGLDHLTGKVEVIFDKSFRASYLRGEKYVDQLMIAAIREQRLTIGDFPGFNDVLLSYPMLQTLVRESTPSWKSILSSIAGVYVITETTTGKHYVGSAYGGDGIWQRWATYAKTGHGGNKELRALLRNKGKDHAQHFQFSLLEVCDIHSSDEHIIGRETHWKNVLRSREFGLNKN